MSEHCGCAYRYRKDGTTERDHSAVCRERTVLKAEVERLRAFVREKCGPREACLDPAYEWFCEACGAEARDNPDVIVHEPDCLWVACAIDPKLSER